MRLIENINRSLKGIFSKDFGKPEIDKKHLGELIDIFNNISSTDYLPNEKFWSNILRHVFIDSSKLKVKNQVNHILL